MEGTVLRLIKLQSSPVSVASQAAAASPSPGVSHSCAQTRAFTGYARPPRSYRTAPIARHAEVAGTLPVSISSASAARRTC